MSVRAHLLRADIDLQTHITGVQNAFEAGEPQQVVLVGHSYAGMLVTAVVGRWQQRLSNLV